VERHTSAFRSLIDDFFTFGAVLAVAISWGKWHHIGWAIVHGICSWFYVFYFWWTRT
jgi:hypothetical protein